MKEIHDSLEAAHTTLLAVDRNGGSKDPQLHFAVKKVYEAMKLMANKLDDLVGYLPAKAADDTKPLKNSTGQTIRPFLFEKMPEGQRVDVAKDGTYKLYHGEVLAETGRVSNGCRIPDEKVEQAATEATTAQNTAASVPNPHVGSPEAAKGPEKAEPVPQKATPQATNQRPATVGVGQGVSRNPGKQHPGVGPAKQRMRMGV